jgi:hypothetical protein
LVGGVLGVSEGVRLTYPGGFGLGGVRVGKIDPVAVIGNGRIIGVAVNREGVRVAGGVYCGRGRGCTTQPPQPVSANANPAVKMIGIFMVPLSDLFYPHFPDAEILKYWMIDS